MRSLFLCGLLVLISAPAVLAQSTTDSLSKRALRQLTRQDRLDQTDSYFVIEALGTFHQAQDQALSQQIYRGWGGGVGFGNVRWRDVHYHEFQARGGYNYLRSAAYTRTHDFWGNFSYRYLRQLRPGPPWRLWIGGQADFMSRVRYTPALGNSNLHWEIVGSLGAAARVQRSIRLPLIRPEGQFYGHVHLPLLAYVNRPAAPISISGETRERVSPIGRLRKVDMEFGVFFPVRRGIPNFYRLSYRWDLFRWRDNDYQRVITGQHLLSFGLLVNMI